ncbi:MAG TPA: allantoate amidohydrolase [Burkholderiales bacterium]|jgi:hydantoinase/carbamoylase family amidase
MNPDHLFGAEIMARCDTLARLTEEPGRLTRTYLTPVQRAAADQLLAWMIEAGMSARIDAAGNVVGRYEAAQPGAKTLISGSHFDTVVNAGKYDGNYGVIAPIACVKALHVQGLRLPHAIEVVGFAEEEGVRYKTTMMGSRAIAGTYDPNTLKLKDRNGISVAEAMTAYGLDPDAIGRAAHDPGSVLGFVEIHIEQGPVLLNEALAAGTVTSIAGGYRFQAMVAGQAGHAGTTPMHMRRDAGAAAAEMILAIERYCAAETLRVEGGLVGTVGQLNVPGGAINVIPGACEFSIDLRSGSDASRHAAWKTLEPELRAIAQRRSVELTITQTLELAAAPCAPHIMAQVDAAIAARTGAPARRLPSGAGHDAMTMAALCPQGMIFIRCGNGGISHNPLETITVDDARLGAQVLYDVLRNFTAA